MECKKCRIELPEGAVKCPNCGRDTVDEHGRKLKNLLDYPCPLCKNKKLFYAWNHTYGDIVFFKKMPLKVVNISIYVCESCGNKVEILFPDDIDTMIGRRKNYSKEKRQKELAEYEKTYLERLEKSKNL